MEGGKKTKLAGGGGQQQRGIMGAHTRETVHGSRIDLVGRAQSIVEMDRESAANANAIDRAPNQIKQRKENKYVLGWGFVFVVYVPAR